MSSSCVLALCSPLCRRVRDTVNPNAVVREVTIDRNVQEPMYGSCSDLYLSFMSRGCRLMQNGETLSNAETGWLSSIHCTTASQCQ